MSHKQQINDALVVGVSARALFDMAEDHLVFEKEGKETYLSRQRELENVPFKPGSAFPLVARMLQLNERFEKPMIKVVILSGIDPDAGIRVMNGLDHYGLDIGRAAFTGGQDICPYLRAFNVDLFLSASREDVQKAVNDGFAAALMYDPPKSFEMDHGPLRIAFDGDAVLFDAQSELIYKTEGLKAFSEHEKNLTTVPMEDGPLARFMRTLHDIQASFPEGEKPFRIALVTMRSGAARARAIQTLRAWGVEVDEAYFLGGVRKENIIAVFRPHIFFDDQEVHLLKASELAPAALVPYHSRFEGTALTAARA